MHSVWLSVCINGEGPGTCCIAAYMSRLVTSSALQSQKWQLVGIWQCIAAVHCLL